MGDFRPDTDDFVRTRVAKAHAFAAREGAETKRITVRLAAALLAVTSVAGAGIYAAPHVAAVGSSTLNGMTAAAGSAMDVLGAWWGPEQESAAVTRAEGRVAAPAGKLAQATPPAPAPAPPPPPASEKSSSGSGTVVNNNYVTQPVVERIITREVPGAASEAWVQSLVDDLELRLNSRISSIPAYSGGGAARPEYIGTIGLSQKIDSLSGVTITNPTITGGSITATSVSGTITAAVDTDSATIDALTSTTVTATSASSSYATTTTLRVNATTTTNGLRISSLDCSGSGNGGTLTTDASGNVVCAADDSGGGGGASDFIFAANYGAINAATTSQIWAQSGINASSSSRFVYASTTALTISGTGFFDTASTTNLTISSVPSALLKTTTGGTVAAAVAGTDYVNYAWPFTVTGYGVSTSTTAGFTNGVLSTASSTFTSTLTLSSLGTGGLAVNNGVVYNAATTTFSGGLTYSNGNVTMNWPFPSNSTSTALTFTGGLTSTGLTSLGQASSSLASVLSTLYIGTTATTSFQGSTSGTSTIQGFLSVAGTNSTSTFSGGLEATRFSGTTASSSLAGLRITSGGLQLSTLTSCAEALETDGSGNIVCGTDATGSGGAAYPFQGANNSTSTLTQFNGGLTAFASSTIGSSSQAGGLTISGGATTTGNAYFASSIGVGTQIPGSTALVINSTAAAAIQVRSADSAFSALNIGVDTSGGFAKINSTQSGGTTLPLQFLTGGTAALTIDTSQRLGIGTTTPSIGKLQVAGDNSGSTPQLTLTGSTNPLNRLYLGFDTTNNYGRIQAVTENTAYRNLILNDSGGNVGIGTTTPWAKLSIEATAGSNAFTIGSSTATNFLVNSLGRVGIGSTSPMSALDVNGSINFSGKLYEDGVEILGSMIAPFAGSCPTGWTEYTAARGRTVVGTPSGGTNAGTVGSALSDLGSRTVTDVASHLHTVDPASTNTSSSGAHTHTYYYAGDSAGSSWPLGGAGGYNAGFSTLTDSQGSHTHSVDIAQFNSGSTGVASVDVTMPYIQLTYCQKTAGSDLAEWIPASEDIRAATIVSVDPDNREKVVASRRAYDNSVVGIVATKPGWLLGQETQDSVQMALAGRVPVRVSLKNGEIKPGDPITTSSIPGVGMRATDAGPIVGKAMEAVNETSSLFACLDPGTGREERCAEALVFVNISWYSPGTADDLRTSAIASNAYPESLSLGADFKDGDLAALEYAYAPQQLNAAVMEKVGYLRPASAETFAAGVISKRVDGPGELLRRTRINNKITEELHLITSGKADVAISDDSSAIKPGDPIAVSRGDAGMAEKAYEPGFIIGRALEAWDPTQQRTSIAVLIDSSWFVPPIDESTHDQDPSFALFHDGSEDGHEHLAVFEHLLTHLTAWLADAANGITKIVTELLTAKRVETVELCVEDVCVTREQFAKVFGSGQTASANAPSSTETSIDTAATLVVNGNNPVEWPLGQAWNDNLGALFTRSGGSETIYSTSTVDTTLSGTTTIDYWAIVPTTQQWLHATREIVIPAPESNDPSDTASSTPAAIDENTSPPADAATSSERVFDAQ